MILITYVYVCLIYYSFFFSIDEDDLIKTLKKEEIDLLKVISFLIRRMMFALRSRHI